MSRLPFEDAFKNKMNEITAGNEDASWQKMKALLDKKEKRKPFFWINFYSLSICVIVVTGFWVGFSSLHNNVKKTTAAIKVVKENSFNNDSIKNHSFSSTQLRSLNKMIKDTNEKNHASGYVDLPAFHNQSDVKKKNRVNYTKSLKSVFNSEWIQKEQQNNYKNNRVVIEKNKVIQPDSFNALKKPDFVQNKTGIINLFAVDSVSNKSDNSRDSQQLAFITADSINAQKDANTLNSNTVIDSSLKLDQTKQIHLSHRKEFSLQAGLQLMQQIPLGNQKLTAYNYNGKKNFISNYIPSAYIRFENKAHWFSQVEFSYQAPYMLKEFNFYRQTQADYNSSTVVITNYKLQKAYFTQIPLTFNYYVKQNWFAGTGVSYNWFHGAVVEKEILTNDIKGDDTKTTVSKVPFRNYNDSFLYKTQVSLILQTGYSVRNWSFTLRYQKGLQPYIKYTLPSGGIESKKTSSLEVRVGYNFIRQPIHFRKIKQPFK